MFWPGKVWCVGLVYFRDRAAAGKLLAEKLGKYRSQNIIVVALDPSSAVTAAQVAMKLHSSLLLYVIRDIVLPGETQAVAGLGSGNVFTFNQDLSEGQRNELTMEFNNYIEQQRLEKNHEIHMLLGNTGEINKDMLRHRTIVLVADGLPDGFKLGVIAEYLKAVAIKKLVIAVPMASVAAIDRMHLVGDEIVCLSVVGNYMGTDHYYEQNAVPDIEGVRKMMENISFAWDRHAYETPPSSPSATA